jgi:glycosyltransferase involved in cell wall biosynthesis
VKIVHFSTVHFRDDSRIRSKMMASLQKRYPNKVSFLVQDGLGGEVDVLGYRVIDTGPRLPRLARMTLGGWRMFRSVLIERPNIAHFHDPELIPWGVLLRLFGINVIYDVHEDYPEAVSENYRLPVAARKILPAVVKFVEWASTPFFSAIVAVTPTIQARFPKHKSILVRNWPLVSEFHEPARTPMRKRPLEFAYIGTITRNRNIIGMIEAIDLVRDMGASLRLAGNFPVETDQIAAQKYGGWKHVNFDGWVSREGIAEILANARAGLLVLRPVEHEMLTLPIKLFEYMAAGVPIIASDFPLWRQTIDEAGCGLLVDPEKPEEIAAAVRWMLQNPDDAEVMGQRGRSAVLERFNWEHEIETLISTYELILSR